MASGFPATSPLNDERPGIPAINRAGSARRAIPRLPGVKRKRFRHRVTLVRRQPPPLRLYFATSYLRLIVAGRDFCEVESDCNFQTAIRPNESSRGELRSWTAPGRRGESSPCRGIKIGYLELGPLARGTTLNPAITAELLFPIRPRPVNRFEKNRLTPGAGRFLGRPSPRGSSALSFRRG